jgi:hypothetical protein
MGALLSTGVDAVDCHELLERVSVGIVQILVHELLIALAVQLQLRHLHWLVSTVHGQFTFMFALGVNTSCVVETLPGLSVHVSIWIMLGKIT